MLWSAAGAGRGQARRRGRGFGKSPISGQGVGISFGFIVSAGCQPVAQKSVRQFMSDQPAHKRGGIFQQRAFEGDGACRLPRPHTHRNVHRAARLVIAEHKSRIVHQVAPHALRQSGQNLGGTSAQRRLQTKRGQPLFDGRRHKTIIWSRQGIGKKGPAPGTALFSSWQCCASGLGPILVRLQLKLLRIKLIQSGLNTAQL